MKKKALTSTINYGCLLGTFSLLALLPLWVLYRLSDITYLLIYHTVKYRRRVVRDNLTKCFPEKPAEELTKIEKQFYRNFSDYIFETIKLLHISDKTIKKRMTFEGVKYIDKNIAEGRDVIVYFSHTGNWEWTPSICLHSSEACKPNVEFGQIYRPLKNHAFDRLMLKIRGRFGSRSIPKATALRQFVKYRRDDIRFVVGFMSDQTPKHDSTRLIVDMFGRPTAAVTGTETLARRLDTATVYWHMTKPSRGHYHIRVMPMCTNASETAPEELTKEYFRLLEKNIKEQPSLWLWSHKRWKKLKGVGEHSKNQESREHSQTHN